MAVFRVERNTGYTVMSNHHLRNKELSLKAKGLLSQMLSLPEDWDYTLAGLSYINREKIDAIREAVRELERAGYIQRSRERDEKGRLRGTDYIIYEQPPNLDLPTLENPTLENPTQEKPTLENPMQLNKDIQIHIGIVGMRKHLVALKETYPDYAMKIIRQYSDGDYVISEFIMRGTHKGEFIGIKPTESWARVTYHRAKLKIQERMDEKHE